MSKETQDVVVRRWSSPDRSDVVDCAVFMHDTVAVIRRRIALAMECDPQDVWMWTYARCVKPSSSMTYAKHLARRVLAPFDTIKSDDAKKKITHLFGHEAAHTFRQEEVSVSQLTRFFKALDQDLLIEPLNHVWVHDSPVGDTQLVVRCCNPFEDGALEQDRLVSNGVSRRKPTMGLTLRTKCRSARHPQVHFALKQDVLLHVMKTHGSYDAQMLEEYFPSDSNDDLSDAFVSYDGSLEEIMMDTSTSISVEQLRFAYFHVKTESSAPHDVSLHDVFADFEVDPSVPMIAYRNDFDTKYKIHKPSLNRLIENDLLLKWLMQRRRQQNVGYIVFHISLESKTVPSFCSLVLYPTLRYDVIATFSKASYAGDKNDVKRAIEKALGLLAFVRKKLPVGSVLPQFQMQDIWTGTPDGGNSRLVSTNVYFTVRDDKKLAPEKDIKTVIQKYFDTDFVMLRTKGVIVSQYRKVDNFVYLSDVQHFLTDKSHLSKSLMIQHVMRHFGMNQEEATDEVNQWLDKRSQVNDSEFVSIKTTVSQSRRKAGVRIHGVTSMECLRRCIQAHVFSMHVARSTRLQNMLRKLRGESGAVSLPSVVPSPQPVSEESAAFVDALSSEFTSTSEFDDVSQLDLLDDNSFDDQDDEEDEDGRENEDLHSQIDELSKSDPTLFAFKKKGYSTYATMCGKVDERQPVILDKQRQDELNPDGYRHESALHGSDASRAKYYACPDVWCPRSKIAMTYEQYSKAGNKCSFGKEETAVLFENKYWNGRKKRRYIGFLDPSKHPNGHCMPCCFKKPMQNMAKCGIITEDERTDNPKKLQRYVKNDNRILEPGRFGLLPDNIATFFGDARCGSRADGSGPMKDDSDCSLRVGIGRSDNPFISVVATIFGLDIRNVIDKIVDSIDPMTFLTLQNGAAYRSTCADSQTLRIDIVKPSFYNEFQRYIARHMDVFDESTISLCRKHDRFSIEKMGVRGAGVVLRSYSIFRSMREYFQRIESGRIGHELLTDAIRHVFDASVVTFTYDSEQKTISTFLPSIPGTRVFAVFHQSDHYEPIGRVTIDRQTALVNVSYNIQSNILLDAIRNNEVPSDAVYHVIDKLHTSLSNIGMVTTSLLLCSSGACELSFCGLRITDGKDPKKAPLLLPFPERLPIIHYSDIGWTHLDDAFFEARGTSWTPTEIKRILQHIRIDTGEDSFAPRDKILSDDGRVIAMTIESNSAFPIPCEYVDLAQSDYAERYFDFNREVFIQSPATDREIVKAQIKIETQATLDAYALVVFNALEDDDRLMQELRFLRSDYNPFPDKVKRDRAQRLLRDSFDRVQDLVDIPSKFTKDFLQRLTIALFEGVQKMDGAESVAVASRDQIILNSTDIVNLRRVGAFTKGGILSYIQDAAV